MFKISLGVTVVAKVGPLAFSGPQKKRRSRTQAVGTVIESRSGGWRVFWHDFQKTSDHHSKQLRFLAPRKDDVLDSHLQALNMNDYYVGNHEDLKRFTTSLNEDEIVMNLVHPNSNQGSACNPDHPNTHLNALADAVMLSYSESSSLTTASATATTASDTAAGAPRELPIDESATVSSTRDTVTF